MLLNQKERDSDDEADTQTEKAEHHTEGEENGLNQLVGGTHAFQYGDIRLFIEHDHPKGADHIESDEDEGQGENSEAHPFFDIHEFEESFILLKAVLDEETGAHDVLELPDGRLGIGLVGQFHLNGADLIGEAE